MEGGSVEVVPLGGGCEVGRSCILLRFEDKNILLDCGIHPADNDFASLPFFDRIDPAAIDLLLVTHFHLDHCGAVPYFLEKTAFRGNCYMTYPTKALYKHIMLDSLKVGVAGDQNALFSREDVLRSVEKIRAINFHEEVEDRGVRFTAYNAGHVMGAAMFLVQVRRCRVLYTGDYSCERDLHIQPAEIPPKQIDVLIVESTYGVKNHESREVRERVFLAEVEKVVRRGGKVLLPVFVLGRAQELLLLLEEHWARTPTLASVPIYYASTMMAKCMLIFHTYINMMGAAVRERTQRGRNPFDFRHVSVLRGGEEAALADEPMVVMAAPGMLQNGLSRTFFERWCHDKRNAVIFTGYCVENTLARDLQRNATSFRNERNELVQVLSEAQSISFSAHADFQQTKDFIEALKPKLVVLVHGEKHEAAKLRDALQAAFPATRFEAPPNWQFVEMPLPADERCVLVGSLAQSDLTVEVDCDALLLRREGRLHLACAGEAAALGVAAGALWCRLRVFFPHSLDLVFFLAQQVVAAECRTEEGRPTLLVGGELRVWKSRPTEATLVWRASPRNDIVGDCFAYLLYNLADYDLDAFGDQPPLRPQPVSEATFLAALEGNFGEGRVARAGAEVRVLDEEGQVIAVVSAQPGGDWAVQRAAHHFLRKRIENIISLAFYA